MKLMTVIFVILTAIASALLALQIMASNANHQKFEVRASLEASAVGMDRRLSLDALNAVRAMQREGDQKLLDANLQLAEATAEARSVKQFAVLSNESAAEAEDVAGKLGKALSDAQSGVAESYQSLLDAVSKLVSNRLEEKDRLAGEVEASMKENVAQRMAYASERAKYVTLENRLYMLQKDYENRSNQLYRYRYLRPDIQERLSDNGTFVAGQLLSGDRDSVKMNRGSDDGVELYQKFNITRNGEVIATANVVNVSNRSAELEVTDLPRSDWGVYPRAGDDIAPRRFTPVFAGVSDSVR